MERRALITGALAAAGYALATQTGIVALVPPPFPFNLPGGKFPPRVIERITKYGPVATLYFDGTNVSWTCTMDGERYGNHVALNDKSRMDEVARHMKDMDCDGDVVDYLRGDAEIFLFMCAPLRQRAA